MPDNVVMCLRCKVEMKPGKAYENTIVGYPDFPGDTGFEPGSTMSRSGPARLVDCLKCPECGKSIKA